MRFEIGIDYDTPPNRVKDALIRATAHTIGVLAEPAPVVFLKNFGDSAITYEVRYWINDHRLYNGISDGIRTNIWYGLHRQSIKIPYPVRYPANRTPPRITFSAYPWAAQPPC